jgi:phosphoribosylanthranilate isomerase
VVGVDHSFDREKILELTKKYVILVDSKLPGMYGGTGVTHDWRKSRVIKDAIHPGKLFLAGGLNPGNVAEAVHTVNPYGVDVSSGVESVPGFKDHGKMRAFIDVVRRAGEEMNFE